VGTGLAALVKGEGFLDGQLHTESSYWRLVYAAARHNASEHFRMVFAPPISVGGTPGVAALQVVEGRFNGVPFAERAVLLDQESRVLRELEVASYQQTLATPIFQRGDVNVDGNADLSDAVFTLAYLFAGGQTPACLKSADANDTGVLDLSDPIFLLNHLFLGSPAPNAPYLSCGIDRIADDLPCESFDRCVWAENQP
jgi:hypothetical protein